MMLEFYQSYIFKNIPNKDNLIDKDDTFKGIIEASKRIGEKFLDPKVFRAL